MSNEVKVGRVGPGFVLGYAEDGTTVTLGDLVPDSLSWSPRKPIPPEDKELAAERDRAEMGYVLGCVVRDLENPLPDGGSRNVRALRREMDRLGVVVRRVLIELRGDDRDVPDGDAQVAASERASQDPTANGESPADPLKAASAPGALSRLVALRSVREALDPRSEGVLGAADLIALAEWVVSSDTGPAFDLHGFEQQQITERERIRRGAES